jgi:hypothetical protein
MTSGNIKRKMYPGTMYQGTCSSFQHVAYILLYGILRPVIHNILWHLRSLLGSDRDMSNKGKSIAKQRFQSKALCMIVDAPWYVPNTVSGGISAATALYKVLASAHIQMI